MSADDLRFMSIEGIDGAGKTTHIVALMALLAERFDEVVVTREPGGTVLAERLREMVLQMPMDPLTEALLVFAARRDHLKTVIEPALARGAFVICDRFADSSFAYQGGGRGFDLGILGALESWVQQGRQPDITLWFDVPAVTAAARRAAARAADRFEAQDLEFFERVVAGYAGRMAADPGRFCRIDASVTPEQVWQQVQCAVEARVGPAKCKHAGLRACESRALEQLP